MEEIYKEEAKKRMLIGKKEEGKPTLAYGQTRDKLAEKANVSHDTIDKVKKIEAKADKKTKRN